MVREYSVSLRSRAVGMLQGGLTQKSVASQLYVNIRTIRRWWRLFQNEDSLENKNGRGRKLSVPKPAKIIISKSIGKKRHSVRKLSRNLKSRGYSISSSTVYRYLTKIKGAKSFKRQRQPLLTEKQKNARLNFCKQRVNWTVEDWRKILFSDESPFEIHHPPNHKNDCVWAHSASDAETVKMVKHSPKIHVWGMMSYRAVSELHIIPPTQTITADYYINEILEKTLMTTMKRKRKTGSILQRKMIENMSDAVFQQDGAPAHHAKKTQEWLKQNIQCFWEKGVWPGNSPDINPVENLWSIVQGELDTMEQPRSVKMLENNLKSAWSHISQETLGNLMDGMPERVRKCIKLKGGHIGK